ncbi:methyltransferase [Alisedimentitalea sp. MJ-SS2]|uniref:methyltransferase n=1 Tax=Aliisedimentitalea sp. MJ-SS2 TaxID=3049795 RepID=UPI0029087223|nr:methyltransferase [Alisedimentitalea sp. MJ-SS2]MDU8926625.1 methyltransferase [Alisedimentitalea sp. MJ-SS2]
MSRLADIRSQSRLSDILEGQPQHAAIATLLTLGAFSLLVPVPNATLLGMSATTWAKTSILLAILHQVVVAIGFRLQLHRSILSRRFGERDMKVWTILFMPLLISRPITLILTGWADATPITSYRTLEIVLGLALLAPALWALHSTLFHFTIRRALGGDHFRDEIAAMPLVNKGVFRFTANAMYGVAFLGLWGIALLFGSWNALVVALFQHAYIWVHMYCTEKPDMEWIYGERIANAPGP